MSKSIKSPITSLSKGKASHFILHFLFTSVYAYVSYLMFTSIQIPVRKPQGQLLGSLKYLTIWDLNFQLLSSFLNLLVVLIDSKKILSLRNAVHHGLAAPYGFAVFGLFWSIYIVDRNLVFPKELDAIIPPIINHIQHTFVFISPLINEFIDYNERKSNHFKIFIAVYIAYICQLLFFGYYLDFWIYPIFDVLNDISRIVFIIGCVFLGILIFLTHGALHNYLWADKVKIMKLKAKKKF